MPFAPNPEIRAALNGFQHQIPEAEAVTPEQRQNSRISAVRVEFFIRAVIKGLFFGISLGE